MTIGELIRQERKTKGITQDELAKRLGITRSAVGQFEKKDSHLRYDTLKKIANAMDVPIYKFSLHEGERIASIRESKGMTQKELGEKVGLTAENIAMIENHEYRPSNSLILELAKALNTSPAILLPGSISLQTNGESMPEKDDAINGLKAIIRKLFTCIPTEPEFNANELTDITFIENEHSYHLSKEDFRDLIPLVDGLVGAYVDQKKVCDL